MNTRQRPPIHIVGAGFAGCECAYQLAQLGHRVVLHEMRKALKTPAHQTDQFAELVCSNSFGSQSDGSAPGQLKWEAEQLDSLILAQAKKARVPAGQALAVDRTLFAELITNCLRSHELIEVVDEVVTDLDRLPRPSVIASGPLTEPRLASGMREHLGLEFLYFFDAIAPVIDSESINTEIVWRADRYDKGEPDYLNCPLSKHEYLRLVEEILGARKVEAKDFEKDTPYFESCLPIEVLAERGVQTLRFGPLKPKGLKHPQTGREPYAVVQLRQDNREATAFNMVGFQTKMAYPEQQRVFRLIPGLEQAEFLKLGAIHRNLYVCTPKVLSRDLSSRRDPWLFFAGQITGVEGYFESTCIGLLTAHMLHQKLTDRPFMPPPRESAMGSLLNAILDDSKIDFQPTNINFSLFPPISDKMLKHEKRALQISRAKAATLSWRQNLTAGFSQQIRDSQAISSI